jgi:hypothetical protein
MVGAPEGTRIILAEHLKRGDILIEMNMEEVVEWLGAPVNSKEFRNLLGVSGDFIQRMGNYVAKFVTVQFDMENKKHIKDHQENIISLNSLLMPLISLNMLN